MIMGHVRARAVFWRPPSSHGEPHGFCLPLSRTEADRSDALPCPVVPLAMQTLVGTANSGARKCPSPVYVAMRRFLIGSSSPIVTTGSAYCRPSPACDDQDAAERYHSLSEPSREFVSCDHPEFPVIFVMAGNGHFRPFVGWGSRACQLHPRSRALKKLAMN